MKWLRALPLLAALAVASVASASVPFAPNGVAGRERHELRIPGLPTIDVFAPVGRQAVNFAYSEKLREARYKWPSPKEQRSESYRKFMRAAAKDWAEPYLTFLSAPEQSDLRIGSGGQTQGAFATFPCDLPWVFYGNLTIAKDIRELSLSPDEGLTWIPGIPCNGTGWAAAVPPNMLTPGRTYHLLGKYKDKSGREHISFIFFKLLTRKFGEQWVPLQVHITESVEAEEDTSEFTRKDWWEYTEGIKPAWPIRRQPGGQQVVHQEDGQEVETEADPVLDTDMDRNRDRDRQPEAKPLKGAGTKQPGTGKAVQPLRQVPTTGTVRVELHQSDGNLFEDGKSVLLCAYDGDGIFRQQWKLDIGPEGVTEVDGVPINWFYVILFNGGNRQWITGAVREGIDDLQTEGDREFRGKKFPNPEGKGTIRADISVWEFEDGSDELTLVLRQKGGRK